MVMFRLILLMRRLRTDPRKKVKKFSAAEKNPVPTVSTWTNFTALSLISKL
jgi:hypothetical protein